MATRTGKSNVKKVVSPGGGEAERPAGLAKAGPSAGIPGVDDVPATAGMLRGLRTELFERVDQTKHELRAETLGVKTELKADIYETKGELRGEIQGVRTDLRADISQAKGELRAEIQGVKTELKADICETKGELRAEIQGVKTELKADIYALSTTVNTVALRMDSMDAKMSVMDARMSGMESKLANMTVMMEEQSARNKVALDAITAWLDRQGRSEHRMDAVEETVRSLATSRPPRD